jgi:octaprenyl-diphosphate synthase
MDLKSVLAPVAGDMGRVDVLIRARLSSEVALINEISGYIVNSGGKRLRPALVLLSARALGAAGELPCLMAAVIEFIHTATAATRPPMPCGATPAPSCRETFCIRAASS